MSEFYCRGRCIGEDDCYGWVEGFYVNLKDAYKNRESHRIYSGFAESDCGDFYGDWHEVDPNTVGRSTGLFDKNGEEIFEDDIVQYNTYDDFDCHSIVKFGEYEQDGSNGEYNGRKCIGFYVEVDNFTCPDWCDNEPECFPYYMWKQNILEVASGCEVIGNIHDNLKLLGN